jgi:peptidoglycan/xylan/chitin deacetylase (PgdA/CDA1 family)
LKYSGILFLFRYFIIRQRISFIVYHNPSKPNFLKHIEFLRKKYNFISMEDYYNALISNDFSAIPDYALCITFDDGHKNNYDLYEIFKEYNIRPTIYLCSGIVATNRHYWDTVSTGQIIKHLKSIPNNHRLLELRKFDFYNEQEYEDRQALSKTEIVSMLQYVDFQSHTKFHPALSNCNVIEKTEELVESKTQIEELTGRSCLHLAYPHGMYDDEVIKIAISAGYKTARTIDVGWNGANSNPYKLKITGVSDNASLEYLDLQLCGISTYFLYLFRGNLFGHFKLG